MRPSAVVRRRRVLVGCCAGSRTCGLIWAPALGAPFAPEAGVVARGRQLDCDAPPTLPTFGMVSRSAIDFVCIVDCGWKELLLQSDGLLKEVSLLSLFV